MKNRIIYFLSFFAFISLFQTGCEDQEESVITIESSINGKLVDEVAVELNSFVTYEFDVQSSDKLGRMELVKTVNGVSNNIYVVGFPTSTGEKVTGSVEVTSELQLTLIAYGNKKTVSDFTKTITIKIFATTNPVTEITLTSAKTGGVIADVGGTITSRGVVWSTNPLPTIDLSTKTSDGTGTGAFVSSLTNLTPGQTYYVRSYVVTSAGVIYGNQLIFSTLAPPVPEIPNGGFELPVIAGFVMNPQPNVWTFTGGGAGMQRNGSAFGAAAAPEGFQTALFQQAVEISQTIQFTDQKLVLSIMCAQRGAQAQTFELYYDNTLIGKVTPASSAWETYVSDVFTATAGPHKITIKGTNPKGGDNSGFVDNVKLIYKP
jgi:hypothetical protein